MKLPGDKSYDQYLEESIRVNHAGEFSAKKIYEGQKRFIKDKKAKEQIIMMAAQEDAHLEYFNKIISQKKVRPSFLLPLWGIAGYALGAGTAILGTRAAMICTKAVEEVIENHYKDQIVKLDIKEKDLKENINNFLDEEIHHKEIAIGEINNIKGSHFFLESIIKIGCKLAIKIAKRI